MEHYIINIGRDQTLIIFLYAITIIINSFTLFYIFFRSDRKTSSIYLMVCQFLSISLNLGTILEKLSYNNFLLINSMRINLTIMNFFPSFILMSILSYANRSVLDKKIVKFTILFLPIVFNIPIFFPVDSPVFKSVLKNMTVLEDPFVVYHDWGFVNNLIVVKGVLSLIIGTYYMILYINKKNYKGKVIYCIIASVLLLSPLIGFLIMELYLIYIEQFPVNIAPITLSLSGVALFIISRKLGVFNTVPIDAWNAINMSENKIIIFDKNNQLILTNSAFKNECKIDINDYDEFLIYIENTYTGDFEDIYINNNEIVLDIILAEDSSLYYQLVLKNIYDKKDRFIAKYVSIENTTVYRNLITLKERENISTNIHGYLGNKMVSLIYNTKKSKEMNNQQNLDEYLDRVVDYVSSVHMTIRKIVENMSPVDFEKFGLITPINSLIDKFGLQGIDIKFGYDDEIENIDSILMATIYEIVQECITNAIIHGKAKEMEIFISVESNYIYLNIFDYGIGCKKIIKNRGLTDIEKMVRNWNGEIEFNSDFSGGFMIRATLAFKTLKKQ